MANQLKMALIDAILTLHRRGWSQRRIARELEIDRETVARYLRQAQPAPKPAHAPLGAEPAPGEPIPPPTVLDSPLEPTVRSPAAEAGPTPAVGRASDCTPWREVILGKLELGLSAQRIYQDLVAEHGFTGSYFSVRRFVKRLGEKRPLPFRRLGCGTGEEAQVDFGTGAPVQQPDHRQRRPRVFRIVLTRLGTFSSDVFTRG